LSPPGKVVALDVVEIASGKVVHRIQVTSQHGVEKASMGLRRRVDLEKFSVAERREGDRLPEVER
jgi:hypothetical protein